MSSFTKISGKINCLNDILNAIRESTTIIFLFSYVQDLKEKSSNKIIGLDIPGFLPLRYEQLEKNMEKFNRTFTQQKSNEVIALEEKDSEDSIKSNIPPFPIQPISTQKSQKINDELYTGKISPKPKENDD